MSIPIALAKKYPDSRIYHVGQHAGAPLAPDGLPLPPESLAIRVGASDLANYYEIGLGVRRRLRQALPANFDFAGKRVYELGCGVGRVLRHFYHEAQTCEFYGSDIDHTSVAWMIETFSPPFHIFQNVEHPTLPLESNFLDLVFTISVFSHVYENWSQWLMEIRRVLKPGGMYFASFLGPNIFEKFMLMPYVEGEYGLFAKDLANPWDSGGPTVFLSPEWIKTFWGSHFEIDLIALGGLMDYQSIAVMRKPLETGRPPRAGDVPVVQMGYTHAINPKASGALRAHYPEHYRLERAFGIRGRGQVPLSGWVSFDSDRPVRAAVSVQGRELTVLYNSNFSAAPDGKKYTFHEQLDISRLADGAYALRVDFLGLNGETYWLEIPLIVEDTRQPDAGGGQ